jgi:uncharacterized protein (TIGR02231 family)
MSRSLLLLAFLNLGGYAAELPTTQAKISAVTVYSDRAEVVRQFQSQLAAGEHTLNFDQLPASVDLATVRVEGQGDFTLIDIRPEHVQTLEVTDEKIEALQNEIKQFEKLTQDLALAEKRITFQKSALDKVLARLTAVGKESANPDMDPTKWEGYLKFHVQKLADLDKESQQLKAQAEEYSKSTDRLNRQLGELGSHQGRFKNVAHVRIAVAQPGMITLRLSYQVFGPSWTPLYDIRANTTTGNLAVSYQAEVRQSTGEDWKGVALHLSTAQPGIGGREPTMAPWFITKREPVPPAGSNRDAAVRSGRLPAAVGKGEQLFNGVAAAGGAQLIVAEAADALTLRKDKRMRTESASVVHGGTAETYKIERTTDILSNNKAAKVTITHENFPSTFRHTCVPKYSPFVYLKTKAINKSDFTFLPGPTAIFLDGAFVANADIDLVPSGQEFWTYLGVDQSVSVERKVLGRRTENNGLFGKKTVRTVYDQIFKLKNSKSTEVDLVIWDQLPISNHEDIKVVLEEPKYEKESDSLKMNEQHQLEWHQPLKAGEKRELPFRFAIERPEDVVLETSGL